jgi:hypothetical protein
MIKKILFSLLAFCLTLFAAAQNSAVVKEREATGLRAEGKIYVVLAVSLTILIGLFIYLIRIDRKISKLEKAS